MKKTIILIILFLIAFSSGFFLGMTKGKDIFPIRKTELTGTYRYISGEFNIFSAMKIKLVFNGDICECGMDSVQITNAYKYEIKGNKLYFTNPTGGNNSFFNFDGSIFTIQDDETLLGEGLVKGIWKKNN